MIQRATNAMSLGNASLGGMRAQVPLLENEMYFALDALPDEDVEKRDFIELFNKTQAVLAAINEAAT